MEALDPIRVPGFEAAKTGIIGEEESQLQALPLIQQVLEKDPANYLARALKLYNELGINDEFNPEERASKFRDLRDLLPLIPNSTTLRESVATFLSFNQGRDQEAAEVLEAGLLVDPLDVTAIAEAMSHLLTDEELHRNLAEAGRRASWPGRRSRLREVLPWEHSSCRP